LKSTSKLTQICVHCLAFSEDGIQFKRHGAAVVSFKDGVIVSDQVPDLLAGGKVFDDILDSLGEDFEWYRQNDKARDIWVYMPLWSRDEIDNANSTLSLGLSEELLNQRIDTFGLSARYVLETDLKYVQKGDDHMNDAWQMFNSFDQLEPYLRQLGSPYPKPSIDTKACHRVFHYSVPSVVLDSDKFNPESYVMVASSEKTEKKLEELLFQLREAERERFVSLLTSSTKTAPLVVVFLKQWFMKSSLRDSKVN
jgi:hypothetical protein